MPTNIGTAVIDLGELFQDITIRPSQHTIDNTTRQVTFSSIINPPNTRCPISQEDFSNNDMVTQIIQCQHCFHPESISTWWINNVRCPVCRLDIRTSTENSTSVGDNTTSMEENSTSTRRRPSARRLSPIDLSSNNIDNYVQLTNTLLNTFATNYTNIPQQDPSGEVDLLGSIN